MTRSRSARRVAGRGALLLLLALGSGRAAHAQPSAASGIPAAATDSVAAPKPASGVNWIWILLGGVALGVLGARLLGRRSALPPPTVAPLVPPPIVVVPEARPVARNVPRENREAGPPAAGAKSRPAGKSGRSGEGVQERLVRKDMEQRWRDKNQAPTPADRPRGPAENRPATPGKPPIPPRSKPAQAPAMPLSPSLTKPEEPLSLGQTVDLTPTPVAESNEAAANEAPAAAAASPAVPTGPVHYYAPAPDVPSIEHRKLSPNPLPQMPLLVTLAHAEATTAQFSFSPQADQSRIIGNGVRELKEFFAFELPPTEQFTAIRNLKPGKLEKRDDAWHVVQKAEIALS